VTYLAYVSSVGTYDMASSKQVCRLPDVSNINNIVLVDVVTFDIKTNARNTCDTAIHTIEQ